MIQASKAKVIAAYHVKSVEARYLEVQYFLSVFNRISALAGLLAGFSATSLASREIIKGTLFQLIYTVSTGATLGFMLVVLLISSLCTMWGPGKALRSSTSDSVTSAVQVMDKSVDRCFWYFSIGLGCYLVSSLLSVVKNFSLFAGFLALGVICYGATKIYGASRIIFASLTPGKPTSGEMRGVPTGSLAGSNSIGKERNNTELCE